MMPVFLNRIKAIGLICKALSDNVLSGVAPTRISGCQNNSRTYHRQLLLKVLPNKKSLVVC